MYNRIELFFTEFDTIYNLQFGFRKKYSTEHALLSITEEIRKNLDKGLFSCGVFVDLEKAFDTVNHKILLAKLQHYGIRDNSLNWLRSYLNQRTQFVNLSGIKSNHDEIRCGVPQGSVLGPLLFIIYVNDMHKAVKYSIIHHFADDTNLLFSSKKHKEITKKLNRDLQLLFDWLCANRLSLNVSKTEFIVFRPVRRPLNNRIILKLNGNNVFESTKIKYLGVLMDSRLSWKHHINELSKKLNRSIGMIFKIRDVCTKNVLISLYHSLFQSHLSYALAVWGSCSTSLLNKLHILQKKVVRAISFSDIFKNLGILKIQDMFTYKTISLMWDYDHNLLPNSLAALFVRRNKIHNKNLCDKSKNKKLHILPLQYQIWI